MCVNVPPECVKFPATFMVPEGAVKAPLVRLKLPVTVALPVPGVNVKFCATFRLLENDIFASVVAASVSMVVADPTVTAPVKLTAPAVTVESVERFPFSFSLVSSGFSVSLCLCGSFFFYP